MTDKIQWDVISLLIKVTVHSKVSYGTTWLCISLSALDMPLQNQSYNKCVRVTFLSQRHFKTGLKEKELNKPKSQVLEGCGSSVWLLCGRADSLIRALRRVCKWHSRGGTHIATGGGPWKELSEDASTTLTPLLQWVLLCGLPSISR